MLRLRASFAAGTSLICARPTEAPAVGESLKNSEKLGTTLAGIDLHRVRWLVPESLVRGKKPAGSLPPLHRCVTPKRCHHRQRDRRTLLRLLPSALHRVGVPAHETREVTWLRALLSASIRDYAPEARDDKPALEAEWLRLRPSPLRMR